MKKALLILTLFPALLFAQEKNYFQQTVDYKIDVTLDDLEHSITAEEIINYTNNSPDKLEFIYFHLFATSIQNQNGTDFDNFLAENKKTATIH